MPDEPGQSVQGAGAPNASSASANGNSMQHANRSADNGLAKSAVEEAMQGRLTVPFVYNNGKRENLRHLVDLKNIYCAQLTEMPKEYIVRQVFAYNHENLALMRDGVVIGGICYRPFYDRKFIEIVFLAVRSEEQVKGYGSVIMQNLKEGVKKKGITHMLTYADNDAIGYFRKQGFTREITLPHSVWVGCIKDYEGGTLVECQVSPVVNYREISEMTKRQRAEIFRVLERKTPYFVVQSGLTTFRQDDTYRQIDVEQIPGLKEAGFSAARRHPRPHQEKLKTYLTELLDSIRKHSHAWPFQEAVSPSDVWDYYEIIKDPIDLGMIQKRLNEGYYVTQSSFVADVRRMCSNARTYNAPHTEYYKCAVTLMEFVNTRIKNSLLLPLES